MLSKWREKSPLILLVFNVVLMGMGWIMAVYSYPRLPGKIFLWFDFSGQPCSLTDKSPVFFIYPLIQTVFFLVFSFASRVVSKKVEDSFKAKIYKESVYLSLIFFNLIFIHIQRGLIFMSHQIAGGVNLFYFYALFVIILVLIPYYRLRMKQT